jgi:hypothetical protein
MATTRSFMGHLPISQKSLNMRARTMFLSLRRLCTIGLLLIVVVAAVAATVFVSQEAQDVGPQAATPLNPIRQENQRPGTTAWGPTHKALYDPTTFRTPAIEGYASATSVQAGDTLNFSVSTNTASFTGDVYRLGWYGGSGGRLIHSVARIQGHFYPMPALDKRTGLIEANWPVAFTLTPDTTWTTGEYLVKLTAANGMEGYIPFTVRSARKSAFVFLHAANTDEAYNYWGGTSLYGDYTNTLKAHRAFKVSFDRPFEQVYGSGHLLLWEYPMIRWLEKNAYDIGYASDVDVQTDPSLLQGRQGILIVGHSEYWSGEMRDHLEAAVSSGVNLAVFAANSIFNQIRYEPSLSEKNATANRIIVCYKDAALDPLAGKDDDHITVAFRDPPLNRPEQSLLGGMVDVNSYCQWGCGFDWVVADASNWVFADTGLRNGDKIPGLVGYEYDQVLPNYPIPPGNDIISASPVIDVNGKTIISNGTVSTAKSGARVVNIGTIDWSGGLDGYNKFWQSQRQLVNKYAQKITQNILQNFLATGQR